MYEQSDDFFSVVSEECLCSFQKYESIDPVDLSTKIMNIEEFPMHAPVHHFLVPAVLLTAARKAQGHSIEVLERDLNEALERAKQVQGGSCGFLGACGASVGCGIFFSLITDSSPYSTKTWSLVNKATSKALGAISDTVGPRCCKRCTWLSLLSIKEDIDKLAIDISLKAKEKVICEFHERNEECITHLCPFYPIEEL